MIIKSKLCRDISTALGLGAASLVLGLLPVTAVQADSLQWIGANSGGDWTNGANWLDLNNLAAGVQPQAGDDVLLTDSNLKGTAVTDVTYTNPGGIGQLNSLVIDGAFSSNITLNQAQDDLTTVTLAVGNADSGTYNMNGGTLNVTNYDPNVQTFVVANQAGAYGDFNQFGGTVNAGNDISLGQSSGSVGVYNIDGTQGNSAASLNVGGFITMGFEGEGIISQTANSTVTVGTDIYMHNGSQYIISGGNLVVNGPQGILLDTDSSFYQYGGNVTVSAADLVVGNSTNSGSYYQDNSLADSNASVAGNLSLGRSAGTTGGYTLADSGSGNQLSLTVTGNSVIGDGGTGTFTQQGGTHTTSNLILGAQAGAQGTYNLQSGLLQIIQGNLTVGDQGTGHFNQDNSLGDSIVTISQNLGVPPTTGSGNSWNTGNLYIGGSQSAIPGGNPGSTGTYTMTDQGTGNVLSLTVSGEIFIGGNNQNGQFGCQSASIPCSGAFIQDGGTVTVDHSGNPAYGYYADMQIGIVGGTGSYTLNSGTLTTPSTIEIGNTTSGNTFTQNGGTVNTGNIWIANADGSGGTYTLNGGVLNAGVAVGVGGTGVFINAGGTQNGGDVVLGAYSSAASGTYSMTGVNSVLAANNIIVGQEGYGEFNQFAGSVTAASVSIGGFSSDAVTTGNGVYTLADGSLNVSGDIVLGVTNNASSVTNGAFNMNGANTATLSANNIVVGLAGGGQFLQSAGTVNAVNIAIGGYYDGANYTDAFALGNGIYTLSGGTVNVLGNTTVGGTSQGSVLQTGGVFNAGYLSLGSSGLWSSPNPAIPGAYLLNSSGSYDLEGGTLNTNGTVVSVFGMGAFTQGGASVHTVTGDLIVGENPAGIESVTGAIRSGMYTLKGGQLSVSGNSVIGGANSSTDPSWVGQPGGLGTFTQTGGSHKTTNLIVGQGGTVAGGTGVYNLSGGASTVTTTTTTVGSAGISGGNGTFNQSGGFHSTAQLVVGDINANGVYNLTGGNLNVTAYNPATLAYGQTYIGQSGTGQFNQSGVSNFTTNFLGIASEGGGGNGGYALSGGTLTVNYNMAIGTTGNGVFNQSGGAVYDLQNLYLGGGAGSSGQYNLSGGSIYAYNLIEAASGVLSENIGTGASYLTASFASFGGEIKVGAASNFVPTVGETFMLAQISGSYSYAGLNIVYSSALAGDTFQVNYNPNSISLTVLSVNTAAAVPVPAGFWLFGSALLGYTGLRKSRKSA